jgi:hypothetical protein
MITKDQQRAMDLYSGLLDEMKMRVEAVEFAVSGLLQFHAVVVREFSYLQRRMICELIALGCLTAHGDIPATKTLRKAWSAEEIFKALERLHPDFYPHPVEQISKPGWMELRPIQSGFLTKAELLSLNGQCGDILHRGSLRKLMAGPISARQDHPDVSSWIRKIRLLLRVHRIGLSGGKSHFVAVMSASLAGGKAQVAFAEAELPPSEFLTPGVPGGQPK